MRLMASANGNRKSNAFSTNMSTRKKTEFALCVRNDGVPASLELRKLYETLSDADAAKEGMVRVVDESGEDYLYPKEWFVEMRLSPDVVSAIKHTS